MGSRNHHDHLLWMAFLLWLCGAAVLYIALETRSLAILLLTLPFLLLASAMLLIKRLF